MRCKPKMMEFPLNLGAGPPTWIRDEKKIFLQGSEVVQSLDRSGYVSIAMPLQ